MWFQKPHKNITVLKLIYTEHIHRMEKLDKTAQEQKCVTEKLSGAI